MTTNSSQIVLVCPCIGVAGQNRIVHYIWPTPALSCVVNERFISPFRGTYNDNDLRHVTLYAYLKAFRFTGSPVLYLECEIHMCQSACPVSIITGKLLIARRRAQSFVSARARLLGAKRRVS